MYNGNTVTVILPTYAERDSIREVINGFFDTGYVDEVLVVDNNSQAGTLEEVAQTAARVVNEPRQGYGHATRRGLMEAEGDLIVVAEPDGTFLPDDLPKLLVYSKECDVVFGTRTTRELIWAGANMDWFLGWGNW
jgi:glycosyltransferase involved in cell wall biosynthesis